MRYDNKLAGGAHGPNRTPEPRIPRLRALPPPRGVEGGQKPVHARYAVKIRSLRANPHAIMPRMIKALEIAIEKLKALPEEKQEWAAEVIEEIAAADEEVFRIPDDHLPGVLEGLEQMRRGEFASEEEMAILWKKCGL